MEIQTAIDIITDIMGCVLGSRPCCDHDCDFCAYRIDDKSAVREAFDIAVDSLNNESEAEKYRTSMKVHNATYLTGNCPRCGNKLNHYIGVRYCDWCGQALDWTEVER